MSIFSKSYKELNSGYLTASVFGTDININVNDYMVDVDIGVGTIRVSKIFKNEVMRDHVTFPDYITIEDVRNGISKAYDYYRFVIKRLGGDKNVAYNSLTILICIRLFKDIYPYFATYVLSTYDIENWVLKQAKFYYTIIQCYLERNVRPFTYEESIDVLKDVNDKFKLPISLIIHSDEENYKKMCQLLDRKIIYELADEIFVLFARYWKLKNDGLSP